MARNISLFCQTDFQKPNTDTKRSYSLLNIDLPGVLWSRSPISRKIGDTEKYRGHTEERAMRTTPKTGDTESCLCSLSVKMKTGKRKEKKKKTDILYKRKQNNFKGKAFRVNYRQGKSVPAMAKKGDSRAPVLKKHQK